MHGAWTCLGFFSPNSLSEARHFWGNVRLWGREVSSHRHSSDKNSSSARLRFLWPHLNPRRTPKRLLGTVSSLNGFLTTKESGWRSHSGQSAEQHLSLFRSGLSHWENRSAIFPSDGLMATAQLGAGRARSHPLSLFALTESCSIWPLLHSG